jgi:hypothetical protein
MYGYNYFDLFLLGYYALGLSTKTTALGYKKWNKMA